MNKRKVSKKKQSKIARISKNKKLKEWSQEIRNRDEKCIICGRIDFLNAHHILPKENYHEFMFEPMNGVTLCPTHHKFGKYSAHKNAIWFVKFLKNNRKQQYEWAVKNVGEY